MKKASPQKKDINETVSIPKKREWNWNAISSIGTIIASAAAIFAIFQGNCQYKKSLDRADKQIEMLEQERESRIEENRPQISAPKVEVFPFKDNYKQFGIVLSNTGKRPAYNLRISSIVIRTNDSLRTSQIVYRYENTFVNPINISQEVSTYGDIPLSIKNSVYYIREVLIYTDALSNKPYSDSLFYYWKDFDNPDYNVSRLYGASFHDKEKVNQQISILLSK